MLSRSPKISVPSSGSRGKEAKGPSPQLPSPALGPGREHWRVTARMNKPGSSARAAGSSLLLPAWPGMGSGSAELLGCCVLQGAHPQQRFFGAPSSPPGSTSPRQCLGSTEPRLGPSAGHRGGRQHRCPLGWSGSAPWLTLGPCSRDEVVCRGLRSSFRSEPQRAGR